MMKTSQTGRSEPGKNDDIFDFVKNITIFVIKQSLCSGTSDKDRHPSASGETGWRAP